MAAPHNKKIPILTDAIPTDSRTVDAARAPREPYERDMEAVIAELQTRLAARTFALTDELLQTALAGVEAKIHEQVCARLRRELPELIDALLREYLAREDR